MEALTGEDGYEAVLIPAGTFTMGCTREQGSDCDGDEKPSHSVRISRSFYMMKSEVTQGLYKRVMGSNPSEFKKCGSSCPVETVSWVDAAKFANKLSRKEGGLGWHEVWTLLALCIFSSWKGEYVQSYCSTSACEFSSRDA